jgi:hypothetical protein
MVMQRTITHHLAAMLSLSLQSCYIEEEMSAGKIDKLLKLLADVYDTQPLFTSSQKLYTLINTIKQGDVPWNGFSVSYNGARPPEGVPQPPWMNEKHEVWFRDPLQVLENQITNPNFNGLMDLSPKRCTHSKVRAVTDA